MEFLKAGTIDKIICLAEECCQHTQRSKICHPCSIKIHITLNEYIPKKIKLSKFIDSLMENEKIELLALVKLGRDDADSWTESLADTTITNFATFGNYIASKALRLPSYLIKGLDKLAK